MVCKLFTPLKYIFILFYKFNELLKKTCANIQHVFALNIGIDKNWGKL